MVEASVNLRLLLIARIIFCFSCAGNYLSVFNFLTRDHHNSQHVLVSGENCRTVRFVIFPYPSEAQCSTFVFTGNGNYPYNVTFTTDKILLKSLTRDDVEGTLNKGQPGSPTYEGDVVFTDENNKKYHYVFHLRSSSFYWTPDGETAVTSKWLNGIPIGCTLPGEILSLY